MAFNSPIDLQLPQVPAGIPDDFVPIFQSIFNALRTLQINVGDTTGFSFLTSLDYFKSLAPSAQASITVAGQQLLYLPANTTVTAGRLVGLVNSAGVLKTAHASAAVAGQLRAIGWAMENIAAGSLGVIALLSGYNNNVTGLTPAQTYWLSDVTPGGIVAAPPVGAGKLSQEVGVGLSAVEILMHIRNAVTL
jgi:hypothetical protein